MLWQTNFMLQRLATPGEKVQLDAPPMPQARLFRCVDLPWVCLFVSRPVDDDNDDK